jgi:hypothetical protein
MPMMVLDPAEQRRLKRERALTGADRFDEVWDGVYMMAPLANNEHQWLALEFCLAIRQVISVPGDGMVFPGCNVSDREEGWKKNYRCPDVAVFLKGNPAKDCDTHWFGGPDFAVEIVSPGDRSRDKLGFYAKVGVRELLILDRKPWRLELYRLDDDALTLAETCSLKKPAPVTSTVIPFRFALREARPRPSLLVSRTRGGQTTVI